jgi:hypothetical protein
MRVRTFGESIAEAGTDEEIAAAYSRVFGQADQLAASVRYEYLKAGVAIGLISAADYLVPSKMLVDWLSDITTTSTLEANWKFLADAIDKWAGEQRDRAEADPSRWEQWAENGKEYGKIIAEFQRLAWESTGIKPLYDALVSSLNDLKRVVQFPVTPSMWPWWLPVGLALGIGALIYSKGRQ